jgi:hypothetical protein
MRFGVCSGVVGVVLAEAPDADCGEVCKRRFAGGLWIADDPADEEFAAS